MFRILREIGVFSTSSSSRFVLAFSVALCEHASVLDRWEYEPRVNRPGQRPLRPDGGTPARNPADPDERYYVELKPNTPSGKAAAARAVKRYQDATGRTARPK